MNVYAFDHTLYPGSSTADFFRFCVQRKPRLRRYRIEQHFGMVYYGMGGVSESARKEYSFSYLREVEDASAWAGDFWAERSLSLWTAEVLRPGDVVVSAAPTFLLEPVCRRLGLELIAGDMDPASGKIRGEDCSGTEKVRRFRERYPDAAVDRFYSGLLSDQPMAELAKERWFVRGGKVEQWPRLRNNNM